MHNKHAVNRCLIAFWMLLPWATTAAVPPPPLVRSVLTTNLPAFGNAGQALFRTANSPYTSWSNSPPSIPISAPTRLVVEGDSTSLSGAPAWPYWLTQTYGLTNGLWVWGTNAASNGATVTNMIAEYAGQIAPWKPAGGTNAILFLWAGINDLAAGASSNDVVRDVSNYCATAKADGFKICLLTIGRSAAVVDAGRVGANEALRFGGFADWVVDAGRMFPPPSSAAAVTNYYIDVTHLSTNAHRLLAAAIRDTLFADDRRGIRYDPWADGNIEGSANISLRSGSKLAIGNTVSGLYGLEVYGNAYFNGNITGDGISTSFSGFRQYDTAGSNYIAGVTYDAGLFGVGTNLPQSLLHVTADNSLPYIVQFGTTNLPQGVMVNTNGYVLFQPIATTNMGIKVVSTNLLCIGPVNSSGVMTATNIVMDNLGRVGIGGKLPTTLGTGVGTLETGGPIYSSSSINISSGIILSSGGSGSAITWQSSSVNKPQIFQAGAANAGLASLQLTGGSGVGSPSNNLFAAGQVISSNGSVFKVHQSYTNAGGASVVTNIVPLTVLPATGTQTNFFEVNHTNLNTALPAFCVNSNGVTQANPGGGLNPIGCYGSLMMNATNIVVCAGAAGVYTNAAGTGYTTIVTNGFYGATAGTAAALTNLYAGYYRVTICASALGANNQATEWEVFTNSVACDLICWKKTYDAAARMDGMSATGIIYLPASCRIAFKVQDGGTGGSISVHRAALTVGTP